ncbi:unnamed protein product [Adineta ricciae]|nr:unnamed protein product [Adineta ricciae]
MFAEIDQIIEERNCLQEQISAMGQQRTPSPLIKQIEQWRDSTVEKVRQVAADACQQVNHLLNLEKTKLGGEFKDFSRELAHLKESENFAEKDLARLNQKIADFKKALRQATESPSIVLQIERSNGIDWQSLIYVEGMLISISFEIDKLCEQAIYLKSRYSKDILP